MGWLRRRHGRHVLGAAVTAVPSGPLTAPAPAAPAPVVAASPAPSVPDAEPDLLSSIAQLIATGEAWAQPEPRAVRPARQAPPVHEPVVLEPEPEPQPEPVPVPRAGRLVQPFVPPQPTPVAQPPRVQLGFRDGTATSLDPASEQSQALEELAQLLTGRG